MFARNSIVLLRYDVKRTKKDQPAVVSQFLCEQEHWNIFGGGRKKERSLSVEQMKSLDGIEEKKRYVAPPFMATPGKVYSW